MIKDTAIDKAIIASLFFHALVLLVVVGITFPQLKKTAKKKSAVEVSYRRTHQPSNAEHPIKPTQQLDLNQDSQTLDAKRMPVPLTKVKGQLPAGLMTEGKQEHWRSLASNRRKITITPISTQKINNPAYAAYNEMVRSRIEEKVWANYDRLVAGKVYLTFIIAHDGKLRAYQVINERSTGEEHLKEISLQSLRQAGPFPAFLKGMTLPEYTFNIEVQYQVGD